MFLVLSLEDGHERQHRHGDEREHERRGVGAREVERLEAVLDEQGQGLAEYALILTFIAVVLVVALAFFDGQINTMMSNVGQSI